MVIRKHICAKAAAHIFNPTRLCTAESIVRAASLIFGSEYMFHISSSPGFLHSRIVVDARSGLFALNMGKDFDRNKLVFAVDNLAFTFLRTVSHACLTTGANIRSEADLAVTIGENNGFQSLRKQLEVEPQSTPLVAVLTRGKKCNDNIYTKCIFKVPRDEQIVVLTSLEAAKRLSSKHTQEVEFWPLSQLTADHALDHLVQRLNRGKCTAGDGRVLLEAGPLVGDQALHRMSTLFLTVIEDDEHSYIPHTKPQHSNQVLTEGKIYKAGLRLARVRVLKADGLTVSFRTYLSPQHIN